MMVLRRKNGHWVEITHKSGDVMRIKVTKITAAPGATNGAHPDSRVDLQFMDEARNFDIQRPERKPPITERHPARCPAGMNCQWSKAMYDSCPQCGYEGDSPKEQPR